METPVKMSVGRAKKDWPSFVVAGKSDEQIRQMILDDERMTLIQRGGRGGEQKTDAKAIQKKIRSVLLLIMGQINRDYKDREDQKVFHLGLLLNGLTSTCAKHGIDFTTAMSDATVMKYAEIFTPDALPEYKLEPIARPRKAAVSTTQSDEGSASSASDTVEEAVLEAVA